jgi:hypothetical protein
MEVRLHHNVVEAKLELVLVLVLVLVLITSQTVLYWYN